MKKTITLAVTAAVLLSGCAYRGGRKAVTAFPDETGAVYTVETVPYRSIVSPDFRNILWGMNETEIYSQEKKIADGIYSGLYEYCTRYELEAPDISVPSENSITILEYRDIERFGYSCRLFYYVAGGMCISAEYVIPADEQQKYGQDAFEKTDGILGEIYCPAEVSHDASGAVIRRTPTADIRLYASDDGNIHVVFTMPEGYLDTPQTSRVVIFEGDHTIVVT